MNTDSVIGKSSVRRRFENLCWLLALGCWGCSGTPNDGLKKFPVRGLVFVNDKPAAGMVVTFRNVDVKAPGNATRPVGRCDDQGRFELSTNGDKDGTIEGQYAVTFFWPSGDGPMLTDQLANRFSNAERSTFKCRIEPKENNLEPFRLTIDPKILASSRAKKDPPE